MLWKWAIRKKVQEPSEKMKAAKVQGEDFYDPRTQSDNILGRNNDAQNRRSGHLKDPIVASMSIKACEVTGGEPLVLDQLIFGPRLVVEVVFNGLRPRGSGMVPKRWDKPLREGVWLLFGPVGQRAFAHSIHALERFEEVWAAW